MEHSEPQKPAVEDLPLSPTATKSAGAGRLRAALLTFTITAVAAVFIGRHFVLNVFPTRAWWVKKDLNGADERERAEYIETLLYSRLSDESKLKLLIEGFGSDRLQVERAYEDLGIETRTLSPTGHENEYKVGDRIPYLRKPLTELVVRTLSDGAASQDSRRHALYFFNVLIDLARQSEFESRSSAGYRVASDRRASQGALADATGLLVPFLTDADLAQKRLAVRAFAAIGMPEREFDGNDHVRRAQVFPTTELLACLSDRDTFIRFRAVRALGFVPNTDRGRVVPALLERFGSEADHSVRLEVVYSLGAIGVIDGHDPRPTFATFLKTPRPLRPDDANSTENSPWSRDSWLRMEILIALTRMLPTPEVNSAAQATFQSMTPASRQLDSAGLAAAAYLGLSGQGAVVLPVLRWQWAERIKTGEIGSSSMVIDDLGLFTFAAAVLDDRTTGRSITSELIRLLPAMKRDSLRFAIQPRITLYNQGRYRAFPPSRQPFRWWEDGYHSNFAATWLSEAIEQIGPPDPADLPALRALLDYDGKGVTINEDAIREVRREAAKAILRHLTFVRKAEEALAAVIGDPTSHPELRAVAEEQQKRVAGRH